MAGTPFPFPKSSTPGARPGEGEGRYMNCAPSKEGDRTYIRTLFGLARRVATGKTGYRGHLDVNGTLYVVFTGSVVTVSPSLTVTTLTGNIPGSDPVTISRNNKVTGGVSTPDIVAVRSSGGAYVLTSSDVSVYPDADLPATVNSVAFQDGYFEFSIPDGRFFNSELNSTAVNALSFTTAEARADGLRRIAVRGSISYALGGSTIEPYQNVGTSPFPLQRAPTVIPVGILSTTALAGEEEAWDGPLFIVGSDKTVKAVSGFRARTVSTRDVNRFIAASTVSTIEVSVFVKDGSPYAAVSSDVGTWLYDVTEDSWHERVSVGATRWRASRSVYSNDQWVFGDKLSGDLLVISDTLTENGDALGGFFRSGQLKEFPRNIVAKMEADFTEADMPIFISWSGDGGKTWSDEIERSLSNTDKFPVDIANLGKSTHHGFIINFRWTGSAAFSFSGAVADRAEQRGG